MSYLSEDLILSVRNLASLSSTGAEGSQDEDILLHADEALRNYILPRILTLREEYFVLKQRSPLVASQTWYRLPSRAAFNKLRALYQVQNGKRVGKVSHEMEGNGVLLDDDHQLSGELEFVFFQRPGSLVLSENARQVLTVDPVTKVVTFADVVPTTWTNLLKFDVHSEYSGAELKLWDVTATTVSGTSLTFSTAIDGSLFGTKPLEIGDWVVLAGNSAIPCLPIELHGALSRQVAMHYAEAAGDAQQVSVHAQIIEKYFVENLKAMETRVEEEPIRLGAQGKGFLARGRY